MEQTEPDFSEIERRHDEPPDEPHPRWEDDEDEEPEWAPVAKPDVDDYSGFARGGDVT